MDSKKVEQNGNGYTPTTSFEEAIILTKNGKFHMLLLFGCGCCLIAMVAEVFGTAFLIPAAECEFDMGPNEKGILNAICYIGMITSSHLWGYLADTKGRRKMLIFALVMDGICSLLSSFSHAYWLFLLLRFLNGFFICAPSAVVFAYLGEFHSLATRTRAVLLMSVFLSLGGLYQQGLAWLLIPQVWMLEIPGIGINYSSWRVFVVTGSIPSFVAALMLGFLLPESPKYLFSVGKEQEALQVLRDVFAMNTGQQPEEYPVNQVTLEEAESEADRKKKPMTVCQVVESMWNQTKPLFQKRYLLLTSLAFIMQFSFYASFNGFAMWLPDIYNRYAQYSEEHANHTLNICEVIEALKLSPITDFFIESVEIATVMNATQLSNSSIEMEGNFSSNLTGLLYSVEAAEEQVVCTSNVNPIAFRNSMIIGFACMFVYSVAGFVIKFVDKKRLMAGCLLVSSISGFCIYLARTEWLIILLSSLFIAMSGTCVNILNSIVIDSIPTQLRKRRSDHLYSVRYDAMLFLLVLLSVPQLDASPETNIQNDEWSPNTGLPATLLLSALDVEKIVHDGLNDKLVSVYNFFSTQLGHSDTTETVGSADALRSFFEYLETSSHTPAEIKSNIGIIARYIRREKSRRILLVPFDFASIRRAGLMPVLNRVVSYMNEDPEEAFFGYENFDLQNPLLPFLIFLTSRNVNETVKNDIKCLLPHLKGSPEVPVSSRILIARDKSNGKVKNSANLLNNKELNSGPVKSIKESSSNFDSSGSKNSPDLVWLFDIIGSTEHLLRNALKINFLNSQKNILDLYMNFEQFRDKMMLHFKTLSLYFPKADAFIPNDLRIKVVSLANSLFNMMKDQIAHNVKMLCSKDNKSSFVARELLENLNHNKQVSDEIKKEMTQLLVDSCDVAILDQERIQEIDALAKKYDWKENSESGIAFLKELEDDVEDLINGQGLVSNGEAFERHLPPEVTFHLQGLGTAERKKNYQLPIFIPSAKERKGFVSDVKPQLKQGIRNLIFKYTGRNADAVTGEKYEIPDEVKFLPLDFELIRDSGCLPNLVRLYEYFKTRSFDKVLILQDNEVDRQYLLRNMIDMILRKEYIRDEIKNDAKCVSSFVFTEHDVEERTYPESTDLYEKFKEWPLNLSQIILDGHAENLLRISEHLKSHYQDLFFSVQKNEVEKLRVLMELMNNILDSHTVSEVLKNDVRTILRYISLANAKLKAESGVYPVDVNKLIFAGLSGNMERVVELCRRHFCERILEPITDHEDRIQTFIQLLETIRSFNDTSEQLKRDIDAILPHVIVAIR